MRCGGSFALEDTIKYQEGIYCKECFPRVVGGQVAVAEAPHDGWTKKTRLIVTTVAIAGIVAAAVASLYFALGWGAADVAVHGKTVEKSVLGSLLDQGVAYSHTPSAGNVFLRVEVALAARAAVPTTIDLRAVKLIADGSTA